MKEFVAGLKDGVKLDRDTDIPAKLKGAIAMLLLCWLMSAFSLIVTTLSKYNSPI